MENENDINWAEIFWKIGKEDVEVSKLLYDKEQYPAAVFHLQQGIEKLSKAIGIFAGVADIEDVKNTGHRAFKVFVDLEKELLYGQEKMKEWAERSPELKSAIMDYEPFGNIYQNMLEDKMLKAGIEKSVQNMLVLKKNFTSTEENIENAPGMISQINQSIEDIDQQILINDLSEKFIETVEPAKKVLVSLLNLLVDVEGAERGRINEAISVMDNKMEKILTAFAEPETLKMMLEALKDLAISFSTIYILSIIIPDSIAEDTRYPVKEHDYKSPIEIYDRKNPLVKNYPLLWGELKKSLEVAEKIPSEMREWGELIGGSLNK